MFPLDRTFSRSSGKRTSFSEVFHLAGVLLGELVSNAWRVEQNVAHCHHSLPVEAFNRWKAIASILGLQRKGGRFPHSWPLGAFNGRVSIVSILKYWRPLVEGMLLPPLRAIGGLDWKRGGRLLRPFLAIGSLQ
jgi:hypothetical protein